MSQKLVVYVLTPVAFHSGVTTTCRTCEAELVWALRQHAHSEGTLKSRQTQRAAGPTEGKLGELTGGKKRRIIIQTNFFFLGT